MTKPTPRLFLSLAFAAVIPAASLAADSSTPIDRRALVTRHNVVLTAADVHSPLSVGNGEFAFTADVTGSQTFEADYRHDLPLSTMTQRGFHTMPNPQGFSLNQFPQHGATLPLYLPGNGGLLYATALTAARWEGAPTNHAPGFPNDGNWSVKWEGLKKAP